MNSPKNSKIAFFSRLKPHTQNLSWLPLVLLVALLLNLWSVQDDIWDGVIFAYGNDIGDLRGWERFLDQSGWELAVPIILFAQVLGEMFGGNYFVGYKLIASFSLALLTYEVFRFLRDTIRVSSPWPALGASLAISSTVWTLSLIHISEPTRPY